MYLVDIKPNEYIPYLVDDEYIPIKMYLLDIKPTCDEYIPIKMYLVYIKPTWWIYFYQNVFTWYKAYVMNIFLSKCI